VIEGLAGLARRGTAVDVVHGNRDFLLDARFERQSGARVFPNGCIGRPVEAEGSPACLLIHGDELCTLDRGYQRLKRVLRSPAVAWTAPRLPARLSLAVARRLRRASVRALAHKPRAEATQQPEAVLALAAIHAAGVVVCGHAHAFRDERLVPAQPPVGLQGGSPGGRGGVRWIVIGAFGTFNDLLRVGAGGRIEPGRVRA
jgi:UDP-2,3-diacylglucosamine hydrolase